MNTNLTVAPLDKPSKSSSYDLSVVALGYEERARHLVELYQPKATQKWAWAFDKNRVLSFEDNVRVLEANGYKIASEEQGDPEVWINGAYKPQDLCCRVFVDISSMTRRMLARIVEAMRVCSKKMRIEVDFFYSAAEFVRPPESTAPNIWAGPVLPSFAGWTNDPALPTALVLGLGYEPDRAVGAVEYLEPQEVIVYEPISSQPQFTPELESANEQLWSLHPAPRKLCYRVETPYKTLLLLDGLIGRLVERARPVILPFGPKVFALVSLLVASWYPSVAVWRVSAGAEESPVQRRPTGEVFGLHGEFGAKVSSSPQ